MLPVEKVQSRNDSCGPAAVNGIDSNSRPPPGLEAQFNNGSENANIGFGLNGNGQNGMPTANYESYMSHPQIEFCAPFELCPPQSRSYAEIPFYPPVPYCPEYRQPMRFPLPQTNAPYGMPTAWNGYYPQYQTQLPQSQYHFGPPVSSITINPTWDAINAPEQIVMNANPIMAGPLNIGICSVNEEEMKSLILEMQFQKQFKMFPKLPLLAHRKIQTVMPGFEITDYFDVLIVKCSGNGIFNSDQSNVVFCKHPKSGEFYMVAFSSESIQDQDVIKFNQLMTSQIGVTVKETTIEIRQSKTAKHSTSEYYIFSFELTSDANKFVEALDKATSTTWRRDRLREDRKKRFFSRDILGRIRLPGVKPKVTEAPPSSSASSDEANLPKRVYQGRSDSENHRNNMAENFTRQQRIWPPIVYQAPEGGVADNSIGENFTRHQRIWPPIVYQAPEGGVAENNMAENFTCQQRIWPPIVYQAPEGGVAENSMAENFTRQQRIWPPIGHRASEEPRVPELVFTLAVSNPPNDKNVQKMFVQFTTPAKLYIMGRNEFTLKGKCEVNFVHHENSYDELVFLGPKNNVIAQHHIFQWQKLQMSTQGKIFRCQWGAHATLATDMSEIPSIRLLKLEFSTQPSLVEFFKKFTKAVGEAATLSNVLSVVPV